MSIWKKVVTFTILASPAFAWVASEAEVIRCNRRVANGNDIICNSGYPNSAYCMEWTVAGSCNGNEGVEYGEVDENGEGRVEGPKWKRTCSNLTISKSADCVIDADDCLKKYHCSWDVMTNKCDIGVALDPEKFAQQIKAVSRDCVPSS